MKIPVVREILSANDQMAGANRAALDAAGVFAVNLMASPGAGKTSLILAIAHVLTNNRLFRISRASVIRITLGPRLAGAAGRNWLVHMPSA